MSLAWPSTLIDRVAADRWVLFIGSGVSASCTNVAGSRPPDWKTLLRHLCDLISDGDQRAIGLQLIDSGDLLSASDHVRYVLDGESNVAAYGQAIRTAVEGPAGDKYRPSRLFDALLAMDPRTVFTTNYDKLFEQASKGGFRVHPVRSTTLGDDLRLGEPVFVRLHGSTDAMNDLVLTRTDFAEVTKVGKEVFSALKALSLTSTILFVGYSLEDPDIQLILQEVGRPGPTPEAHFMLAPEPTTESRIEVFKQSFGVSVIVYPSGEHSAVEPAIADLADLVLRRRA